MLTLFSVCSTHVLSPYFLAKHFFSENTLAYNFFWRPSCFIQSPTSFSSFILETPLVFFYFCFFFLFAFFTLVLSLNKDILFCFSEFHLVFEKFQKLFFHHLFHVQFSCLIKLIVLNVSRKDQFLLFVLKKTSFFFLWKSGCKKKTDILFWQCVKFSKESSFSKKKQF